MRTLLAIVVGWSMVSSAAVGAGEAAGVPEFRAQEIDTSLKVGYGVKLVDLNGDKRTDIVVADSARVIWFENPGGTDATAPWKLHTVVDDKQAGIKADNVCLDVYDIDGDGKPDIALGADWQPGNTKAGGSLQWLQQGKNIDDPWVVHPIFDSAPTLHRIHFGDLDGDGKQELIVGPLKGQESTAAHNFTDVGPRLTAYPIPKDPAKDKWEGHVLTADLHVMHNFLPVRWDKGGKREQVLTASYEGVNLLSRGDGGKWSAAHLGEGDQSNPKASRGSSEIKVGRLRSAVENSQSEPALLATIEPFHGNQVVVYTAPAEGKGLWTRSVIDKTFQEGHGIWCADFDEDGNDEVVAGWRAGERPGIKIFKAVAGGGGPGGARVTGWKSFDLDIGGVAVEDLACADLNGDGKVDIVAVGRATHNVKVYWNQGPAGK